MGKRKDFLMQLCFFVSSFPVAQFRLGIQFRIYIKYTLGLDLYIEIDTSEGLDVDSVPFFELLLGLKFSLYAEVGIYTRIVDFYIGASGTILDEKAGFRVFLV